MTRHSCIKSGVPVAMIAAAAMLLMAAPLSRGNERVEYEGELRFCISKSEKCPLPLVHVIVQDGQVQQITFRNRSVEPNRVEMLDIADKKVIRYQLAPTQAGQAPIVYDLTKGPLPEPVERERITGLGEMLLRCFYFHSLPVFPQSYSDSRKFLSSSGHSGQL